MLKSKNKYLRFVANAILFVFILFLVDQLFGRTLKHYYFKTTSGDYYRTTYAMDSTNAEIIILGSSRASHHYIPKLIEDSLGMSCYNTGRDGNFLLFNYAVFKSIVKRYSPKIIILDINPSELYQDENDYEGLATLLPYYQNKPELKDIIELRSKVENYKMLSAVYPFNSTVIAISKGNLGAYNDNNNKGYLPLFGSTLREGKAVFQTNVGKELDNYKLNVLDSMALICSQKGIYFIVVQSPRFVILKQENESLQINRITSNYNYSYWNLVNDSLFINNPELFRDGAHLNDTGAQIFTRLVSHRIMFTPKLNIKTQQQSNITLSKSNSFFNQ